MQWINWPLKQLQASVSGENVQINQQALSSAANKAAGNWRRTVSQNDQVILTIEKIDNHYFLEHVLRQYSIKITDLGEEEM